MRKDTGFAPNPDFDVCTLAACTPNHMHGELRLQKGDYIAGCFRGDQPPRLVYVMKVDEIQTLDEYYRDERYQRKKPTSQYIEGDNIYYVADGVHWQDEAAHFHRDVEHQCQDVRGNRVFIGREFVYLGGQSQRLPEQFVGCLPARGIQYLEESEDSPLFDAFLEWRSALGNGKLGTPKDRKMAGDGPGECERCGHAPRSNRPRSCRR